MGVIAVLGTITATALMLLPSNGQLNEPGDGDDNRYNIPINSSTGIYCELHNIILMSMNSYGLTILNLVNLINFTIP